MAAVRGCAWREWTAVCDKLPEADVMDQSAIFYLAALLDSALRLLSCAARLT